MTTVLCVSARMGVRDAVTAALRPQGLRCVCAADLDTALAAIRNHRPEVVICDLSLPGDVGHELCRRSRSMSDVPTIMLTDASEETEELLAFAAGAHDYMVWPASPRVLAARVKVAIRHREHSPATRGLPADVLEYQSIGLVRSARQVTVDGRPVHLTRTEFDLLAHLMDAPQVVLERSELLRRLWGERGGDDHLLEVHVSRLRSKILAAGGPAIIDAVRGVGYRLVAPGRPDGGPTRNARPGRSPRTGSSRPGAVPR